MMNGPDSRESDWRDYRFSQAHPGDGPAGAWTQHDWDTVMEIRDLLGPALLRQIGWASRAPGVYSALGSLLSRSGFIGLDGVRIQVGTVPPNTGAITLGNTVTISLEKLASLQNAQQLRALLAHEYVHVLQERDAGAGFVLDYSRRGMYDWKSNPFEAQGVAVEDFYNAPGHEWVPAPWEFPQGYQ